MLFRSGYSTNFTLNDNSNSVNGATLFGNFAGSGTNKVYSFLITTPKNYAYNSNYANSVLFGVDNQFVGGSNPINWINFLSSTATTSTFKWAYNSIFQYSSVNDLMVLSGGTSGNLWVKGNISLNSLSIRTTPTLNSNPTQILVRNSTTGDVEYITLSSINSGTFTGGTVSGATNFTNGLTANTISATSLTINGVNITGDTFVTGGTYNNATGSLTLRNNFGNSLPPITGFTTGGTSSVQNYWTAGTSGVFSVPFCLGTYPSLVVIISIPFSRVTSSRETLAFFNE